ncbi:hypothetical protein GGQ65_005600 [Rhizobium fabae]|uniref:Uncharacterized protein n=1 Tax=Rhizobium fabae TaxID=573179 RepID=A0A7W6B9T5_9HYPH|nr:hypothetical protein [Rhizobium fabae]
MRAQFGNITLSHYPVRLRITEAEDVFLALTSYPPGEGAGEPQLAQFRQAIADAFRQGDGVLEVRRESALFLSGKTA